MSRTGRTTIQGKYGDVLKIVAVDENGNIIGLLKGEYLGTLKTLATDDEGRLLAKIYDPDDVFGVSNVIGLAEQAQAIKAPLRLDKRGDIAFYDDFDATVLHWGTGVSGAGGAVALNTANAYTGERSVMLTAGSDMGVYARIYHRDNYFGANRIGFEFAFCMPTIAPFSVDAIIQATDLAGDVNQAAYRVNVNANTVQYYGTDFAWHDIIAMAGFYYGTGVWQRTKFVFDLDIQEYVRCIYNNQEYDLTGIGFPIIGAGATPGFGFDVYVYGVGGNNPPVNIDNIVATVNEP